MRWRVRLYCGHVQEVMLVRSKNRPPNKERCTECGKEPSVIVAFEPLGPMEEPASAARRRRSAVPDVLP